MGAKVLDSVATPAVKSFIVGLPAAILRGPAARVKGGSAGP
jgi:hypothetical protein